MAEFIVPNFKFESLSKKLNTIANKCKKAGVDYRMEIGELYPQHPSGKAKQKSRKSLLLQHTVPTGHDQTLRQIECVDEMHRRLHDMPS